MEALKVAVKARVRGQGRIWDYSMRYPGHLLITSDLDPALELEISRKGCALMKCVLYLPQQRSMLETRYL